MRVRQKPATLHHRAPCVDCIQKSCVQLYYSLFQSDEDIKVGSRDRQQNKVSLTRRAGHNLPLNLRQVRCPRATVGYRMSLQPLAGPAVGYRLLLPPSVTAFCYAPRGDGAIAGCYLPLLLGQMGGTTGRITLSLQPPHTLPAGGEGERE